MRVALALALACSSARADEGDEYTPIELYRPAEAPPPPHDAALALVERLVAQARAPDRAWLRASVRPMDLPIAPEDAWYDRLAERLGPDGALGGHLRATEGVVAAVDGPDYVRVLLAGEPRVSVVVRNGPEGPVVDRIEVTTCDVCTEPVRFVRDLVAEVTRRRSAAGRLLPGVELDVSGWLAANPDAVPHHWLAALEARNHGSGHLAWLLDGAHVGGADGDVVDVTLADGTEDRWTVAYRRGRWVVDYAALPESSPLRMSFTEAMAWRDDDALEEAALQGWTPVWQPTEDGSGVLVGDRAIGAAFDPRDGTLLVGVLDLDRRLAGVVRVDPDRRDVIERIPIEAPAPTTPIAWRTWFEGWAMALGPHATRLAMTTPGRVWVVDLLTREARVAWRADDVVALGWGGTEGDAVLIVGTSDGDVAVLEPEGPRWLNVGSAPLLLDLDGPALLAVTADGRVVAAGEATVEVRACPGDATSAARDPLGVDVLVTCADGAALAARVPWPPATPRAIPGAPSDRGGASFSPDAAWFTTGAAGTDPMLLWDALEERPVATLGAVPARAVSWSPDGARLATVDDDGGVWLWDLGAVRRARGL